MNEKSTIPDNDLKMLSRLIDRPIPPLRPYETYIGYQVSGSFVSFSIETHLVTETRRELRLNKRGVRMVSFVLKDGDWAFEGQLIMWDDDFTPIVTVKSGKILTMTEWRAQRNFERDCHRPGASRMPLDNFDRTFDGLPVGGADRLSSPKMQKHWGL